jgi:short-subunit dehydrogenase
MRPLAHVTGASSGIGLEFARQLAEIDDARLLPGRVQRIDVL